MAQDAASRWVTRVRKRLREPNTAMASSTELAPVIRTFPSKKPRHGPVRVVRHGNTATRLRVNSGQVVSTRNRNIDASWFSAQVAYISSLSARNRKLIKDYTNGSYSWLAPHMRNGSYKNKPALNKYVLALKRVIANAPPVTRAFVVYRGVKGDVLAPKATTFVDPSFVSTGYDAAYAMTYMRDPGTLMRITLLPGTRALLAAGINTNSNHGESEIVLDADSKFTVTQRSVKKWAVWDDLDGNGIRKKQINVTELQLGPQ